MPHTPKMKVLGLFVFTLLISCSLGAGEKCFEHECGATEDGVHIRGDCTPDGCCQEYCQCFMGFAFPRDCGEGRVYDKATYKCVVPYELAACGVPTPVLLNTVRPNDCTAPPNNCTEDGVFSEGPCLGYFCKCWNKFGWLEECMEPLIFDGNTGTCRWESEVTDYDCTPTTTTTTTTESTTTIATTSEPETTTSSSTTTTTTTDYNDHHNDH